LCANVQGQNVCLCTVNASRRVYCVIRNVHAISVGTTRILRKKDKMREELSWKEIRTPFQINYRSLEGKSLLNWPTKEAATVKRLTVSKNTANASTLESNALISANVKIV
jgi:hypothetical protein